MMKKTILSSAVALALGLASVNALAIINLDTDTVDAATFASELAVPTTGVTLAHPAGTSLHVQNTLGFGFATGNTDIYVRYDLTGATFAAPLTAGSLTVGDGTQGTVSLSAGGGVGDNVVIFNIQSTANIPADVLVTLNLSAGGINVPSKDSNPTIQYRLYNTPSDVVNETANSLKDKTEAMVAFAPVVSVAVTPNTRTTSIIADYKQFKNPAVVGAYVDYADLATITVTSTPRLDFAGNAIGIANVLNLGTSTYVVGGDFGGAQGGTVLVDNTAGTATCAGAAFSVGTPTVAGVFDSFTYPMGAVPGPATAVTTSKYLLCYLANADKTVQLEIPESDFALDFVPVANAGFDVSGDAFAGADSGKIERDGTELQATFVASRAVAGGALGGVNRFVFSNNGSKDAYVASIKILTPGVAPLVDPKTAPANFVIPAGGNLALQAHQIIPDGTARTVVHFTVSGHPQYIKGAYQLILPGSDVQAVVQMVPPKYSVELQ